MLIMSWNVAGFTSTVHRIHEHYGALAEKEGETTDVLHAKKRRRLHPLIYFFQRHGADIVCIQEHKIAHSQLIHRNEPFHCALGRKEDDFYESYWSCCVDPKYRGFNGVVTYVNRNTAGVVLSANGTTPLNDPELDAQGRCVITEHGPSSSASSLSPGFVLFNVYVPCSGGGTASLSRKMKFLRALRRAMQEQRQAKQKPVILVGDLNISFAKEDVHWKDRVVYVKDLIRNVCQNDDDNSLSGWKRDIVQHWPEILRILEATQEVNPVRTTNSKTGETFSKFRVSVKLNAGSKDERRICLGQPETSAEECCYYYNFQQQFYYDETTEENILIREENMVPVAVLKELMDKLIFHPRQMAGWSDDVCYEIAEELGTVNRTAPTRLWLQSLYEEDQMIDAFRRFYPSATHRFTCWNQNKNHRYKNYGTRIDYTLVDAALLPFLERGSCATLQCHDQALPVQEREALQAVTAKGRFQPAPFEGGGMMEAAGEVLDTQFAPTPYTGHIYTPPTFSDHIAVSVLLHDEALFSASNGHETPSATMEKGNDIYTRKSQPHKQQPTIGTFFQAANKTATNRSPSTPSTLSPERQNKRAKLLNVRKKVPPPNSVLHHFRKK
jgi:exonuclease III